MRFIAKPIELDRLAMVVARLAGVPLEVSGAMPVDSLSADTSGEVRPGGPLANDLLPALRRRILRAARRCSVTDLKQCLAETESVGPASAAAVLRRGLRSYDMDLILQNLGGVPTDEEER